MKTEFSYQIGEEIKTVSIEPDGDRFRVTIGDAVYAVAARQRGQGELDLFVDGQRFRACVACDGSYHYVALDGDMWVLERPRRQRRKRTGFDSSTGGLEATMPGLVLDVVVSEGDKVSRGDTLVLLEAMKMELRITAPCNGRVQRVHCTAGQTVERGQMLVEIEETGGNS